MVMPSETSGTFNGLNWILAWKCPQCLLSLLFAICPILWGPALFISHLLHRYWDSTWDMQQAMYRNRRNFSVVFVLYLPEAAAVSLSSVTNKVVADKSVVLQPVS